MAKALIVVDIQKDFCSGGILRVKNADDVIDPCNRLLKHFEKKDFPIFLSRDWHPSNHCSFKKNGGIWPPHCIKDSEGAKWHEKLYIPKSATIISKAQFPNKEAYSAFEGTPLKQKLLDLEVIELIIAGLTTEYCVRSTALNVLEEGLDVSVVSETIKPIDLKKGDGDRAIDEIKEEGGKLISINEALLI